MLSRFNYLHTQSGGRARPAPTLPWRGGETCERRANRTYLDPEGVHGGRHLRLEETAKHLAPDGIGLHSRRLWGGRHPDRGGWGMKLGTREGRGVAVVERLR